VQRRFCLAQSMALVSGVFSSALPWSHRLHSAAPKGIGAKIGAGDRLPSMHLRSTIGTDGMSGDEEPPSRNSVAGLAHAERVRTELAQPHDIVDTDKSS